MPSFAHLERVRLCDTAVETGPDAPTLCEGWTVRDLLVHLVVRESDPVGAPGIFVPFLSGLTERASARVARRGFTELVGDVRRPAAWSPSRLPPVDAVGNAVEMFVHHEDIRRAQPGWEPRQLSRAEQDVLWRMIARLGGRLVASAGVPVRMHRTDTGAEKVLRKGDGAVLRGLPGEIVLFLYGRRDQARVEVTGPGAERLRGADLGL